MGYNIIKKYYRWDNTLRKEDAEEIEYPINPVVLDTLKDARSILEYLARKEGMKVLNCGLNAQKETESIDEETGIIIQEKEQLKIVRE